MQLTFNLQKYHEAATIMKIAIKIVGMLITPKAATLRVEFQIKQL